jgi:hypothetical protein
MKYIVVDGILHSSKKIEDRKNFTILVNNFINKGYMPLGGISVSSDNPFSTYAYQAMIKTGDEDENTNTNK